PVVACERTEQESEGERDERCQHAGKEREAAAIQHSRKNIAAVAVGTQKEQAAGLLGTEELSMGKFLDLCGSEPSGRRIGVVAVLLVVRVRRKETGKEHGNVDQQNQRAGSGDFGGPFHEWHRMRGSAR